MTTFLFTCRLLFIISTQLVRLIHWNYFVPFLVHFLIRYIVNLNLTFTFDIKVILALYNDFQTK